MEEYNITVTIGNKSAVDKYRQTVEALKNAYEALDNAQEAMIDNDLDDGSTVMEILDAIAKAKKNKIRLALIIADEVAFSASHLADMAFNECCKGKPKTRAEKAREAVEAIKARDLEKKRGCAFSSSKLPEEWDPDSDVKLQA